MSMNNKNIQQAQHSPFLQQIYDSMLDQAVRDVQVSFGNGDSVYVDGYWGALKKLVSMILESDEKAPLLKFIQDVEMEQRLNDIYQGVSFADTEMHKLNFRPYKMGKGFELMSLCWSALNRKGYLKHISHSTPSNIPSNNQLSGSAETEMAPACFQKYGNPTLGRNCVTCEIRKICNV